MLVRRCVVSMLKNPGVLKSMSYSIGKMSGIDWPDSMVTCFPEGTVPEKGSLHLFSHLITKEQEAALVSTLNPVLKKKRYESNHWDAAITRYREMELHAELVLPDEAVAVLGRMQAAVTSQFGGTTSFLVPHVVDLAKDGSISAHTDSIKFSGRLIAGLSLLSERVMRLSRNAESGDNHGPERIDIVLHNPDRSICQHVLTLSNHDWAYAAHRR